MARRRLKPPVVFLTGTFTEFVGNRDQPVALADRPVLFLLGPAGSEKQPLLGIGWDTMLQLFEKTQCLIS